MDDIDLEDLPIDDRRKLPYDHSSLNDLADRVSERIGIPGIITALKNAGEKSGSGSTSPKGAQGVMQFMPETGARYGLKDPTDPVAAINAAGAYVADISKKLGTKDPGLLAAAYNAGEHRKDIQAGRIPLIPETQKYVTRVKGYLANKDGEGIDPADMPDIDAADLPDGKAGASQEDVTRKYASAKGPQVNSEPGQATPVRKIWNPLGKDFEYRVGPDMANFLAAVDKGVSDPVIGATQRGRELLNKVLPTKEPLFDLGQSYRDTKNRDAYDKPLLNTKAGMAGYATGSGIDAALAGILTGGTGAASFPGAAVAGAGSGYVMPTSNESDAYTNAGVGAALGPLSVVAGRGISKLADTAPVRALTEPISAALNKVARVPKLFNRSLSASVSEPQRDAINTALKEGVPVYSKQVTKPGYELPEGLRAGQREGFDRALSRSVGENTGDLQSAWQAAHANLSDRYDKLLGNKQIPLDFQHMADVSDLITQNAAREPRFAANKEVQDALERAFDAAHAGTPMSGRDYQQALREYSGLATKLFKGTPENPSDPYSARLVLKLIGSLEDQAGQALGPKEMKEFKTLNRLWRNKAQLEGVIPKNVTGNADPRQLATKLGSMRKDEFMYGEGDQTLPNLAKFGSSYMDLNRPPKHGLWNDTKQFAKTAAPYVGTGILEGEISGGVQADKSPLDNAMAAGKMGAAGLAGGFLFNAYRKHAAGQRLTQAEFEALRGAMPEVVRGMSAPGALTRSFLAKTNKDDQ